MGSARILIVEDDVVSAMDIQSKLADLGYKVLATCATGEDAVQKALALRPDLILMDIILKGKMDGVEAAQEIHAHESIAVIYVTTSGDEKTLQRAKITEPFGYIQKPVSSRELHIAVEVALYKHTVQREISTQLQHVTAMCMVDEALLNSHDPHHALRVALHQITFQLDLDAAAVLLFNPVTHNLEVYEGYGFRTSSFRKTCVHLGMDFTNRPAHVGQIEHVPDISIDPEKTSLNRVNEEGFTGYIIMPLYCKDQLKGILEVFRRSPLEVNPDWMDFLKALATQAAVAIDSASSIEEMRAVNLNLLQSYDATIEAWSAALEMRDLKTQGHSQRVTDLTLKIARALHVPDKDLEHVRRGALLHDVGMMGIPDEILLKPGDLTTEELEIVRRHTSYAKNLLSAVPFLKQALDIPIYHHERWDGSGYPEGLKGEEIPVAARIFAVVDVWDTLLSDRPMHQAWLKEDALRYIRQQSGADFDPQVVEVFLGMIV